MLGPKLEPCWPLVRPKIAQDGLEMPPRAAREASRSRLGANSRPRRAQTPSRLGFGNFLIFLENALLLIETRFLVEIQFIYRNPHFLGQKKRITVKCNFSIETRIFGAQHACWGRKNHLIYFYGGREASWKVIPLLLESLMFQP